MNKPKKPLKKGSVADLRSRMAAEQGIKLAPGETKVPKVAKLDSPGLEFTSGKPKTLSDSYAQNRPTITPKADMKKPALTKDESSEGKEEATNLIDQVGAHHIDKKSIKDAIADIRGDISLEAIKNPSCEKCGEQGHELDKCWMGKSINQMKELKKWDEDEDEGPEVEHEPEPRQSNQNPDWSKMPAAYMQNKSYKETQGQKGVRVAPVSSPGYSLASYELERGKKTSNPDHAKVHMNNAKYLASENLKQLKAMPKPKLTKDEVSLDNHSGLELRDAKADEMDKSTKSKKVKPMKKDMGDMNDQMADPTMGDMGEADMAMSMNGKSYKEIKDLEKAPAKPEPKKKFKKFEPGMSLNDLKKTAEERASHMETLKKSLPETAARAKAALSKLKK